MPCDYSLTRIEINSPRGEFISRGDEIVSPPGDFVLEYSLRGANLFRNRSSGGRFCIEIESPGGDCHGTPAIIKLRKYMGLQIRENKVTRNLRYFITIIITHGKTVGKCREEINRTLKL